MSRQGSDNEASLGIHLAVIQSASGRTLFGMRDGLATAGIEIEQEDPAVRAELWIPRSPHFNNFTECTHQLNCRVRIDSPGNSQAHCAILAMSQQKCGLFRATP